MNFKNKILAHKKMIVGSIIAMLLGIGMSYSTIIPVETYNKLISENSKVIEQIDITEKSITSAKEELLNINNEKNKLVNELENIQKEKEIAKRIEEENQKKSEINSNSTSSNHLNKIPESQTTINIEKPIGNMVWITATGSKYHSHGNCGKSRYVSQVSLADAENRGLTPCKKCY